MIKTGSVCDPVKRSACLQAVVLTVAIASALIILLSMAMSSVVSASHSRQNPGITIELAVVAPATQNVQEAAEVPEPEAETLKTDVSPPAALSETPLTVAQGDDLPVIPEAKRPDQVADKRLRERTEKRKVTQKKTARHIVRAKTRRDVDYDPPKIAARMPSESKTVQQDQSGAVRQSPDAASMPVNAPGVSNANDALKKRLITALLARIEGKKRYPQAARRVGAEGTVEIFFSIDGNGRINSASIKSSSGHRSLDIAASKIADDLNGTSLDVRGVPLGVTVPVVYSLR